MDEPAASCRRHHQLVRDHRCRRNVAGPKHSIICSLLAWQPAQSGRVGQARLAAHLRAAGVATYSYHPWRRRSAGAAFGSCPVARGIDESRREKSTHDNSWRRSRRLYGRSGNQSLRDDSCILSQCGDQSSGQVSTRGFELGGEVESAAFSRLTFHPELSAHKCDQTR